MEFLFCLMDIKSLYDSIALNSWTSWDHVVSYSVLSKKVHVKSEPIYIIHIICIYIYILYVQELHGPPVIIVSHLMVRF